jgi:phosphatidylglycerophosphate synthase
MTGLRLLCAPVAALAVHRGASGLALVLFVLAVATDLLDGRLARRSGGASPLGGLLDHATDATFVSLGLLALAASGVVPLPLPLLVAAAFVQYTLDSRALRGSVLRASALGRWNGVAYYVLLGIPVVRNGAGLGWPPDALVRALGWALVATTLVSMGLRALQLRVLRRSQAALQAANPGPLSGIEGGTDPGARHLREEP